MSDQVIPAGTTMLLKGGRALMPDADWNDPPRADIAIAGDKIAGIGLDYRIEHARTIEILDAHDHLVLPGFVNAHYHSHDVLAKGTLEEVQLETWRLYALPPQYPPRSVEEVYARTLLGALECLRSGMTTIQDMVDALSLRGAPHGYGLEGLRGGRHPCRIRLAIRRSEGN
jgi:5-methylthioadenosine/S-adenosylhomocysteine deaminase